MAARNIYPVLNDVVHDCLVRKREAVCSVDLPDTGNSVIRVYFDKVGRSLVVVPLKESKLFLHVMLQDDGLNICDVNIDEPDVSASC